MVIDKIQKLKFVFWIVIFSFLLVLMNSFYQYIYGFDFFRGYSVINEQGVSIDRALTASFGHYNQLGEFIGSILLGLYFFIILNKDKKMKLISLFLFILGLFILFFTYSRGSWMSFLSGLILINLYLVFLNKDKKYFIYLIATFFFFILILIVMGRVFPSILGRFRFLIKLYDAGRFSIYESVINTFIKHPLFGVGLNQLPKFIPEGVDAHNIWLKVLGDTGLVGFVGFLYFMIIYFKEIFYNIKKEIQKPYFYYIIFFSSIYIFTLLENITDANIIDGWDLGIYFWLILGILLKSVYL